VIGGTDFEHEGVDFFGDAVVVDVRPVVFRGQQQIQHGHSLVGFGRICEVLFAFGDDSPGEIVQGLDGFSSEFAQTGQVEEDAVVVEPRTDHPVRQSVPKSVDGVLVVSTVSGRVIQFDPH
jgi:hypothetical protein